MPSLTTMNTIAAVRPIPDHPSWPLLGDSLRIFKDPDGYSKELYATYGEVSRIRAFGKRIIMMLGPDCCQLLFQNRDDVFTTAEYNEYMAPCFRRGLLLLDFEEHRLHRRIMQDAFSRQALAGYLERMHPRIDQTLVTWKEQTTFPIFPRLKDLTLAVGSDVFAGQSPGGEADQLNRSFIDAVLGGSTLLRLNIPGLQWSRALRGRAWLESYFKKALVEKRKSGGDDLFAQLCRVADAGGQLSDDDIINHMIFILMAAHDTATITLTNVAYFTARHPEWQERMRAESRALNTDRPTPEQLEQLPTMGLVIKEALRLIPPVIGLPRGVTKDFEYKGFQFKAGTPVSTSIWFLHRMPEYWRDPNRFDPERFSEARAEDRQHPFLWIPFGGGAHKCIGMYFGLMEVKAVLHHLLLKYRWSVPADYEMPLNFFGFPTPSDGLPIELKPAA